MQTDLGLTFFEPTPLPEDNTPREFKIRYSFQNYVRFRGGMVPEKVGEECSVIACSDKEARQKVHDQLYQRFVEQYDLIHRDIANIHEGEKIIRPTSLSISECSTA